MAIKVYVAGPYSKGDAAINIRNALVAGEQLVSHGLVPYIPHLNHLWHLIYPHEADFWYSYDNHWLGSCDCLLRLPGESKGADREMQRMIENNKPCFLDIPSLLEYYKDELEV